MMTEAVDLRIKSLGQPTFDSPIIDVARELEKTPHFIDDAMRILLNDRVTNTPAPNPPSLELAGPRRKNFFDPADTTIGIVSCGGLCPGINDVIRGLVVHAHHRYRIRNILGFRYGYAGLVSDNPADTIELDPELVSEIHEDGGSILASSRGHQDVGHIVDRLQQLGVNILFTIGGDGTLRGALKISEEIHRRGLKIAVVGIPKTIDNDISYIDHSFGFETAYSEAVKAIKSAHNEARGTYNGIGLVKVMGRHSGALACHAALATSHVNFVLIPEMPIGPTFGDAFFNALKGRLARRQHAVILVAEGAGQEKLQTDPPQRDASGNIKLVDIGRFLIDKIKERFDATDIEYSLKYIDPSYIVRSVPATASDSVYCWQLAQNALHAAMAGKTELIVGKWHSRLVHVPIREAISQRQQVDTEGDLWLSVLETTGQPAVFE